MPELPGSILNDTVLSDTVLSKTVLSPTVLNPSGIWPAPTPQPSNLFPPIPLSQSSSSSPTIYPVPSAGGGEGYSNVGGGGAGRVIALAVVGGIIMAGIFGYAHIPRQTEQQSKPPQTQQQSTVKLRTLYAGDRLQYWLYRPGQLGNGEIGYVGTGEKYRLIGKVDPNYDEIQFPDRPYNGERFVVRHSDVTGPSSMNNR